jgi:Lon protease-like protein
MSADPSPLEGFAGHVRLFPLPNLVMFPHVIQPLHIFEPRYRQMTRDALAGDRLLTLVLLRPGWEADYEGHPALFSVACVARIIAEQRMDDGRFNLLVRGLSRAHILEEETTAKSYRGARVQLLADADPEDPRRERDLRRKLAARVPGCFPAQGELLEQLNKLLKSDLQLGALCDIVAFALALEVPVKQQLLEEPRVERRARRILRFLQKAGQRKFPPEFSAN